MNEKRAKRRKFVGLVALCFLFQNLLTLCGIAWFQTANAQSKSEWCLSFIESMARDLEYRGFLDSSDMESVRGELQRRADSGKFCASSSATVLSVDEDGDTLTIKVHINGYWNHWSRTTGVETLTLERAREEVE